MSEKSKKNSPKHICYPECLKGTHYISNNESINNYINNDEDNFSDSIIAGNTDTSSEILSLISQL